MQRAEILGCDILVTDQKLRAILHWQLAFQLSCTDRLLQKQLVRLLACSIESSIHVL